MRAEFSLRALLPAICLCSAMLLTTGCGSSNEPVQTSPDSIDAFLAENPDEAYTSDDLVAEMEEEEDDGEGSE